MKPSTVLIRAVSLANLAVSAPAYPAITTDITSAQARSVQVMSAYYNLLAAKVSAFKSGGDDVLPTCDLSNVQMPSSSLPPPPTGLLLSHIALGRGTQNYTCSPSDATAAPIATGAVATLFNASCVASAYPDLLAMLPSVALQYDLGRSPSSGSPIAGPTEMLVSGYHYFSASGSPFFDMTGGGGGGGSPVALGAATCAKLNATAAPVGSTVGPAGETAVPWLRLNATSHVPGGAREVYRLSTAGGSAPPTCEGMAENFVVEYSALYWFFS